MRPALVVFVLFVAIPFAVLLFAMTRGAEWTGAYMAQPTPTDGSYVHILLCHNGPPPALPSGKKRFLRLSYNGRDVTTPALILAGALAGALLGAVAAWGARG